MLRILAWLGYPARSGETMSLGGNPAVVRGRRTTPPTPHPYRPANVRARRMEIEEDAAG